MGVDSLIHLRMFLKSTRTKMRSPRMTIVMGPEVPLVAEAER